MKEKILPICDKIIEIGFFVAAIVAAAKIIRETFSAAPDVIKDK